MNVTFPLGRSLLTAALIIAISSALAWLAPAYISTELSHRLLGAMLGAVVVVYANAVPKALASYTRLRTRWPRNRPRAGSPAGAWYWAASATCWRGCSRRSRWPT